MLSRALVYAAILVPQLGAAQLAAKWGAPATPAGERVAAVMEMIVRNDSAFTVRMLAEHFDPVFVSRMPMATHLGVFKSLHSDLPAPRLEDVKPTPTGMQFRVRPSTGEPTTMVLFMTAAGRIEGLDAQGGPPPRRVVVQQQAPPPASGGAQGEASIPLTFVGGRPVVRLRVNGSAEMSFILDSGAGASLIEASVAGALNLGAGQPMRVGSPFGGTPLEATRLTASSLGLGTVSLANVPLVSLDLAKVVARLGEGISGVLSTAALAGYLVSIDYARSSLGLAAGSLPAADQRTVFEYDRGRRLPGIRVSVGERTFDADLDTGSGSSLTLPRFWADSLKLAGALVTSDTVRAIDRAMATQTAPLSESLRIGAFVVPAVSARFLDVPSGPITLGQGVLRNFRLTLDPANRRVRLEPANGPR